MSRNLKKVRGEPCRCLGNSILGSKDGKLKGPEVELCLEHLSKRASGAGAERVSGRGRRGEVSSVRGSEQAEPGGHCEEGLWFGL